MNYRKLLKYLTTILIVIYVNLNYAINILHISDIHFNPFNECSISNIGNCEKLNSLINYPINSWYFNDKIPPNNFNNETNNSFLDQNLSLCFNKKNKPIDAIVITGDLLEHRFKYHFKYFNPLATEKTYTNFTIKTIHYIIEKLHKQFPQANIYFTLGNNDTDTEDYEPPSSDFLLSLQNILTNYIDKNYLITITNGGYFSAPLNNKYQIISLNTNTFTYKSNSIINNQIANNQLSWFNNEVKKLTTQNKKIIIITHIPFGVDVYATIKNNKIVNTIKNKYQEQYLKILSEYKNNIIVIFSGHFHSNYNQEFNNIPIIGTIAFNTYVGNNAGAKIINIDKKSDTIDKINAFIIESNQCSNYPIISDKLSLKEYLIALLNNNPDITNTYQKVFMGNDKQYINNNNYWLYYRCFITNFNKNTYEDCINSKL